MGRVLRWSTQIDEDYTCKVINLILDFRQLEASRPKKGMVRVARVRLNVIGQDGVGKTCLVRLLFGQKFEEQPSTCGLNLSKAVTMMKSHAGIVAGKWQLLNHEEHEEQLNNAFENARTNERYLVVRWNEDAFN